jgi:hypothetical protein
MTDHPIFFSGPMVRALLAGTKTQTRRIVKVRGLDYIAGSGADRNDPGNWGYEDDNGDWATLALGKESFSDYLIPCPYGQGGVGDRLWVRETMRTIRCRTVNGQFQIRVRYEADGETSEWITVPDRLMSKPRAKPAFEIGKSLAYGGFREAWRIALAITSVRVERLQEISDADANAEGVEIDGGYFKNYVRGEFDLSTARGSFHSLWNRINGVASWGANPWVWVVEFKRVAP